MKKSSLVVIVLGLLGLLLVGLWHPWSLKPQGPVRIGLVPFTSVNDRVVEGAQQALAELGWKVGERVEFRSLPADGQLDQLDARLAELMAWRPHLVLAMSTAPVEIAYRATKPSATPLVFAPVSDPLAAGIVTSLAHPGEHTTGIRLLPSNGLRLEYLVRMVPGARAIYVPHMPSDKSSQATLAQIEPAVRALGVRLVLKAVESMEDIERAARDIPPGVDAIFLPQEGRIGSRIDLFVASALARRLPLSAPSVLHVEQGALMSYGFDHHAIGRQAGRLMADILAGASAGDLPVETADNRLHINLRTAQAIGLTVDDALLRQAKGIIR